MQFLLKLGIVVLLIIGSGSLQSILAQLPNTQLIATKRSNEKEKVLNTSTYFKLKTNNGEKITAKITAFTCNGIIFQHNDTVLFQNIRWLRTQRELNKLEKGLAIAGVFAGAYLSIGTIPAGLYFLLVQSNPWVMLAPVATLTSFTVGFKTLKGKRYRTKKWEFRIN